MIQILFFILIVLIIDYVFRLLALNPALEKNGIEPYSFAQHAKYRYITDLFIYWKYAPRTILGLGSILFSWALQVCLFWLLILLARIGS